MDLGQVGADGVEVDGGTGVGAPDRAPGGLDDRQRRRRPPPLTPGSTARDTTVPPAGAPTTCSIFMDSRITTGAPMATASPDGHRRADHRALEGGG